MTILDADIGNCCKYTTFLRFPRYQIPLNRGKKEREKCDKEDENQKITGRFHNFIFFGVSACISMWICEVINDGVVVVADKKGKITLKAKKSR